jgi:hypothetical protein
MNSRSSVAAAPECPRMAHDGNDAKKRYGLGGGT